MTKKWRWVTIGIVGVLLVAGGSVAVAVAASAPTATVYFANESAELTAEAKAELDAHVAEFAASQKIQVNGYVQDSPPEKENIGLQNLSQIRADVVAAYISVAIDAYNTNAATNNKDKDKPHKVNIKADGLGQPNDFWWQRDARRAEVFITK